MYRYALFALTFFLALGAGCVGKKRIAPESKVVKDGVVSLWANWYKDKGEKYDIQFVVQNESDEPIVVMLADLECYRGIVRGELKHTFFNTGERTIDFRPREQKRFNLVCRLGQETEGDLKVIVRRVYESPSGDGKEKGKILAKDVEWKAPSR